MLICGDRRWTDREQIKRYLSTLPKDTTIIEGECEGADIISREEAMTLGLKVERYPANWKLHGKAAGPIRNKRMLDDGKPNLVVAFHNDIEHSKGTKNMLKQAKQHGVSTMLLKSDNV